MWNQKDQVRAAKKWWMQRSLVVLRKEQKRIWNLIKDLISYQVISSLMSLLCFFVCLCMCVYVCVCACGCLSSSPLLSVSLLESQFLSHTLPSSCSPVPFRPPFFPPNLSFQVAESQSWQEDSPGPGMVPPLWKPQWWQKQVVFT